MNEGDRLDEKVTYSEAVKAQPAGSALTLRTNATQIIISIIKVFIIIEV